MNEEPEGNILQYAFSMAWTWCSWRGKEGAGARDVAQNAKQHV